MSKRNFQHIYQKSGVLLAFTLLASLAAAVQYAFRIPAVFVDKTVFIGFSTLFQVLAVLSAIGLLVLTTLKLRNMQKDGKPIADSRIFSVFAVLFEALGTVSILYNIGNIIGSNAETLPVMGKTFCKTLPLFLGLSTIAFLLCIYPAIQKGALKKCIAVILSLGVLGSTVWTLFPYCNYKITSAPMVIDSGTQYAVVFATNDTGTGFLEYTYDGKTYTVYDETAGRIKGDSKIHTVKIPKTHLENNAYRIGSTRILEERSYGGRSGKTVYSDTYSFRATTGADQTYLCISDWHTRLEKAYDAVAYIGDYDGVLLLGDAVPGLMYEAEIVENIVEFGGTVSGGTKPVIYVRGNHETRGGYAAKLPDYLGLDSFYYETACGDYNFLVLDSGEDKPDDHSEYGGMVNYGAYRAAMTDWLGTLPKSDKKTITLVHDSNLTVEDDLRVRAQNELQRLDATQILSGHYHNCEYKEENGLRIFVDGGYDKGTFIASKLTLGVNGYRLEAWTDQGEQVFLKDLEW